MPVRFEGEHAVLRFAQDPHPRGFHSAFRERFQLREPILDVGQVVVGLEICLVRPHLKEDEMAKRLAVFLGSPRTSATSGSVTLRNSSALRGLAYTSANTE